MVRTIIKDTPNKIGEVVTLNGWVHSRRDHGKIIFLDLRDRSGLVQVVGDQILDPLKPESVVEITGLVKARPEKLINPHLTTGSIEIEAQSATLISPAKDLPLPIDSDGYDIDESVRLKYRYLDLRRPRLQNNLRLRSQLANLIRQHLIKQDFVEIETPILTKTTPEGARDFLVPSRLQPGNFYALPQSPQQYKQLLMVAGMERYFQFARCFRDEDPRHDRAYGEFTQLDIELSFVTQEDILQLTEELFTTTIQQLFPHKHISKSPWPRLSHAQAVKEYGSDKPDLRQDKNNPDELSFAWVLDFPLFTQQSDSDFYHGSGSAKFAPSHHMFTAPHPEDIKLLDSDPQKVRGLQHDLVLNGYEVGGGSIRIHQPEIQQKIFQLIGFTPQQQAQFEHLLTAFTYGVPPHGGIAPGLDRLLMAILGEPSLRETIAFPASGSGLTAVVDAPSPATTEQLEELHLAITQPKKK
ncbi:MAG: Aspartate--tRNA ligase [Microgenomates group bacterium ADurb.Bin238]|jgi:aspartyl-tRNA synthetase|nr:MAG: Aspartate--tRNA ligase [Microgenomates group bacterium ADurb.Bin238]